MQQRICDYCKKPIEGWLFYSVVKPMYGTITSALPLSEFTSISEDLHNECWEEIKKGAPSGN